jgi:hypothetical protein
MSVRPVARKLNAVIPGPPQAEPGIQTAVVWCTAAWIPGSREEKTRAPE